MRTSTIHPNLAALLAAACALPALAQAPNSGARITHGSAIFDYTSNGVGSLPTSSNGAAGNVPMNFQLDGPPGAPGTRQIFSGNWFYRIDNDDRERHLANAATRTYTGDRVEWMFPTIYQGGAASTPVPNAYAEMSYAITDTGPDSALLSAGVCIHNTGTSAFLVDLYYAVDIDLDATAANDIYQPLSFPGGDRLWSITDGATTGLFLGRQYSPGGIAHGAGVNGHTLLLNQMTNPLRDDFIPDVNAPGFASPDSAAVMQWRYMLPPGQTVCIDALIGIGRNGVTPIMPAPGSIALLGLGAFAAARRRR